MKDGYKILDADMHINELLKFVDFMDPEYRERGPKPLEVDIGARHDFVASTLDGKELAGPGSVYPPEKLAEGIKAMNRSFNVDAERYDEARADEFGPVSQISAMDTEGIDMAVMYPSAALLSFPSPRTNGLDPKLSAAVCRGYNDWLSDFCSHDPDRMKGVAAVPVHDVEESVIEIRRAVTEQGLVGAFVRSNVINGRNLHDPFYSELESLNIPLVVHEGTAGGAPGADQRFYGSWLMMHMAAHPLEQMLASESIIVGGVLERHPKLRVAFLEAGCSWLVYWLWRLDEELEAWGWHEAPELKERPTEYFLRQCFASLEGDEKGIPYYIDMYGDDTLLWASDYPHPDASYPDAASTFLSLDTLSAEAKTKVLWDNPMRMYGIG